MGRLIDVDEVKKRYPIMENDFGMVVNESLHKELDKIPTVEAISKADMVAILDKIRAEIDEKISHYEHFSSSNTANGLMMAKEIINKYIEGSDSEW